MKYSSTLVHKIDTESLFYNMSAKDILKKRYEIVVILEGVIEQTGNSIQVSDKEL
jgi:potassium inwardly-rectifying channel subfamily J